MVNLKNLPLTKDEFTTYDFPFCLYKKKTHHGLYDLRIPIFGTNHHFRFFFMQFPGNTYVNVALFPIFQGYKLWHGALGGGVDEQANYRGSGFGEFLKSHIGDGIY